MINKQILSKALGKSTWTQLVNTQRQDFSRIRKIKIWKPAKYEALPPWQKIVKKDPFEYKLRSLEEVIEYQKQNPPDFTFKLFFTFDQEKNERGRDTGDHKVKMEMDMDTMKMTKLQRRRLIALLGPRYKGGSKFTLVCDWHPTREENANKLLEMSRELYWEALRAP